jgi:ferric iron reductase protein FhuF
MNAIETYTSINDVTEWENNFLYNIYCLLENRNDLTDKQYQKLLDFIGDSI